MQGPGGLGSAKAARDIPGGVWASHRVQQRRLAATEAVREAGRHARPRPIRVHPTARRGRRHLDHRRRQKHHPGVRSSMDSLNIALECLKGHQIVPFWDTTITIACHRLVPGLISHLQQLSMLLCHACAWFRGCQHFTIDSTCPSST